jgi:hypothetical protein
MEELDRFKSIKSNAHRVFPYHEEITQREYRMASTQYFIKMKDMDYQTKRLFFNNTYYSKDGICWFMYKDYRYFSVFLNSGSLQETAYYGKQARNF